MGHKHPHLEVDYTCACCLIALGPEGHAHGVQDASLFLNKIGEPRDEAIFLACCFLVLNQQVYGHTCHIDTENQSKRAEMTDTEMILILATYGRWHQDKSVTITIVTALGHLIHEERTQDQVLATNSSF